MTRTTVLHLLEGARRARGLAVVIDAFRAFTLAPMALAAGVSALHVVDTPEEALALKRAHPDWLLAGEREGRPFPGFDLPNSPAALRDAPIAGRTLVLRTSSGVRGLLAAREADEVIAASFANAAAVVNYIRAANPAQLSLVCMGWSGRETTAEDVACADYLMAGLAGGFPDFAPIRRRLRADPCGAKFFDPGRPWFPREDFDLCTRASWLDIVPRLDRSGPLAALVPALASPVGNPG